MSEALLNALEQFLDELPTTVRDELSFMMVALSDESALVHGAQDAHDGAARQLFNAQTPIGRLSELINAVSIFDVYFAMDARRRFDLKRSGPRSGLPGRRTTSVSSIFDAYAGQADAIETARRRWAELRRIRLTPAAIAAALAPPAPTRQRARRRPALSITPARNSGEPYGTAIPRP
jgi:hypothetical protein